GFVMAHVGIILILGGSVVSLFFGLDGRLGLLEGDGSDRLLVEGTALTVELPGREPLVLPAQFSDSSDEGERRLALPGGRTLVVEQYRPHVNVSESLAEGKEWNPALNFEITGAQLHEHAWVMAADPAASHVDFGPVVFGFHAARTAPDARALKERLHEGNHLCFLLGPDGALSYVVGTRKTAALTRGAAAVGEAVATPWMDIAVKPDRLLLKAHPVRIVTRAPLPKGDAGRRPAVKVRMEGAQQATFDWAVWEEPRRAAVAGGEAVVTFGAPQARLPFRLTLLDFRSESYPGSNRPATFESRVRVDDPQRGSFEQLIAMNRPLHYRGYTFFQASYAQGERMTSIFSVSRSPGLPLVYAGTALMSLGVVWMFYLKPMIARRQARRALAARARPLPSSPAAPALG
ncbi:MAG TPA: cytochrome c biogenesis protein ResB, partial [Vicinamibacteria bacterium]|nr:cytochrome c biogenesis protein ResB [Vicinamibacteria bacterium]